ncbi:MAG: AAA family ATPase [Deltaproteobacteria bacterium]|nr:AAA family ATPase [Deltaproteobacteria bacterium]
MLKNRYLIKYILEDLSEKMVFVGGPRQVGKTTLAREFVAKHFQKTGYYNLNVALNNFDLSYRLMYNDFKR